MRKLLSQIVAAVAGLFIAELFVPLVVIRAYPGSNFFGFPLKEQWEIILFLGIVLGLINYFLKPLLKTLALPLEIITLGIFTIIINIGLLWLLDKMFDELQITTLLSLTYTTLIIWGLNIIISFFIAKHE